MNCPHCNSEKTHKNGFDGEVQQYKCTNCGKYFRDTSSQKSIVKTKIGMTLQDFTEKFDTEFIVNDRVKKAMSQLDSGVIYEKTDIAKLSGLPTSYPGFSDTLESYSDHQGRTRSKTFYSHPDTIRELKMKAKLT